MLHHAQYRGRHRRHPIGDHRRCRRPVRRPGLLHRLLAVAGACARVLIGVTACGGVHAHGWRDVAVGTQTRYCGLYVQSAQVSLYCQSGR